MIRSATSGHGHPRPRPRSPVAVAVVAVAAVLVLALPAPVFAADTTPPIVLPPIMPPIVSRGLPAFVTAVATDPSGVASMEVRVDAGAWSPMHPADGAWGSTTESGTAVVGAGVTAVAAHGSHSCALLVGGRVACWGEGDWGGLGDGTDLNSSIPVLVSGITTAVAVAGGELFTCALLADRSVTCWGFNAQGQLGNGTTTYSTTPVPVSGITTAIALATGDGHACALLSDARARCWGLNDHGQLGNGTMTNSSTPVAVVGLTGAIGISAGGSHTCAVLAGGGLRCWGGNHYGQLGRGYTTDDASPGPVVGITTATAVSAGGSHTCALLRDGSLRCWGSNTFGQLGGSWTGGSSATPVPVSGITQATAVSAGAAPYTCALVQDGRVGGVWCWGSNAHGEFGNGTRTDSSAPVLTSGLTNAVAVSAGRGQTCARLGGDTATCWGWNSLGQVGDGTTTDRLTPVAVAGTGPLAPGGHLVCVRATDGVGNTSAGTACMPISITGSVGATYVSTIPNRILDTRSGTGLSGKLVTTVPRSLQVTGVDGVPSGAIAVTGNLTVTNQTSPGYVALTTVHTTNPGTSTVNFPVGDNRANGVTAPLGAGGVLWITYVGSVGGATTDVLFDVTGFFLPDTSGTTYVPVSPARILDTRNGTGLSGVFTSAVPRFLAVAGHGGVPSTAYAVTGNLTVTNQSSPGYVALTMVSTPSPTTSMINFPVGDNRANGVAVPLGSGGLWATYVGSVGGATTDLIFDVTGYFVPDLSGATYVPVTPTRLLDTRYGTGLSGKFTTATPRSLQVIGTGGVPSIATAVTGNLTVTNQTNAGYIAVTTVSTPSPTTSTLNFPVGDSRANGVSAGLGSGGALWMTYSGAAAGATTDLVFDVTGYYEP